MVSTLDPSPSDPSVASSLLGSSLCGRVGTRRRSRSPTAKTTPLMVRKMAAASGLANRVRRPCSNSSPTMPTGMVAMISSQAMRASELSTRRWRIRCEEAADDSRPVLAKEDQQGDRGGDMQPDEEHEVEGFVGRLSRHQ